MNPSPPRGISMLSSALDSHSAALAARARKVMPDGNSRHTVHFDPFPIYASRGAGCWLTDVDGRSYLDFVNNYSSLIHGHSHPAIVSAVAERVHSLISVGLPTEDEVRLAEILAKRVRSIEEIRFANSGTEAVMLSIKAARAYTGRPMIAKLEGAYHGTYEAAEVSQAPTPETWGSAQAPLSVPTAAGTPTATLNNTLVLPFNDVDAARRLLEEHAKQIAAVLIDVAPSHIAYLTLSNEFLGMLTEFRRQTGTLLILDEVYSLRYSLGGAQERFAIEPDLIVLGKIIGGGFPIGAVGGSREVMAVFRHLQHPPKLPHGGTYNANPVTMTAGIAAMELYDARAIASLETLGQRLRLGLAEAVKEAGLEAQVTGLGSVAAIVMKSGPLLSYRDLVLGPLDRARLKAYQQGMLTESILVDPRGTIVLSTPMTSKEIDQFLSAARKVLVKVSQLT